MSDRRVADTARDATTWSDALASWLGVPAGQGARAARLVALVFMVSASLVLMKAAQNGIFLAAYTRAAIPWAFAASAVTLATASAVAMSVTERLGPARLARIALGTTAVVLVALRWLLTVHAKGVAFAAYVCIEAASGILLIHTWSTVSAAVDARSARKLLPIAGIGASVAWLVGGLVVKSLVRAVGGAPGLLPMAAGLLTVAWGILHVVVRRDLDSHATRARRSIGLLDGWRAGFSFVRNEPLMRITAMLSLLALITEQLMDMQLMCAARDRLGNAAAISSFFGTFYGVTSGLSLVLLAGLSGRFLAALGTSGTLVAIPAITALAAVTVVVFPGLAAAVVLRGVDRVLKGSLWTPATEQLQMPLPPMRRTQARSAVRGVLAPAGYAASAMVLAAFPSALQVRQLAGLVAVVLVLMAWIISQRVRRDLLAGLHRAVNERRLSLDGGAPPGAALAGDEGETDSSDLSLGDPIDAVAMVAVLGRRADPATEAALAGGLRHEAVAVRMATVAALGRIASEGSARRLAAHLRTERDRDVRLACAAELQRMRVVDSEVLEALKACEVDADHEVAGRCAIARMALSPAGTLAEDAARWLEDPSPHLREAALDALDGEVLRGEPVRRAVSRALSDPRPAIRISAVRAALKAPVVEHEEPIVALLGDARVAADVARLVVEYEPGPRSSGALATNTLLAHPDRSVRAAVARALGVAIRRGVRTPLAREQVMALLRREVAIAGTLTSVIAGIALTDGVADWEVEPEFTFLAHEVELRIEQTRRQVLRLLVLLGQRRLAATVEVGRRRPSRARDAQIAELLELELDKSLGALVVPLYEPLVLRERVDATRKQGLLDQRALADPRLALVSLGDAHLRRCARITYDHTFAAMVAAFDAEDQNVMPAIEHMRLLRRFDLFAELAAEDLLRIAEVIDPVELHAGETIFSKGDVGDELYLVVRGEVDILDGATRIAKVETGNFFGDLSVIDQQPRSGSAVCSTDTVVLRLRGADLDELMIARPLIAMHFLRVIAGRLRAATRRLSA